MNSIRLIRVMTETTAYSQAKHLINSMPAINSRMCLFLTSEYLRIWLYDKDTKYPIPIMIVMCRMKTGIINKADSPISM